MKAKLEKTNAMRKLDAMKIKYNEHTYTDTDAISGVEVAAVLGQEPDKVFKTLVTQGKFKNYYVFMVPVAEELDLKKAAKAVGEKSVEMVKSKELLPLTGYVHGGCSPIGMKKFFTTTIPKPGAPARAGHTAHDRKKRIGCTVPASICWCKGRRGKSA